MTVNIEYETEKKLEILLLPHDPNDEKELNANKMSQRSAAKAIGMSESTFRDKFSKGNFSIHEAFMIHHLLLPNLNKGSSQN